jgi:hypothetical protein
MSDYVMVLGDDPNYEGFRAYCFIHKGIIVRLDPAYGVKADDAWWRSTGNFEGATVMHFRVVTSDGKEYLCSIESAKEIIGAKEVERLMGKKPSERRIGFETPTKDIKDRK